MTPLRVHAQECVRLLPLKPCTETLEISLECPPREIRTVEGRLGFDHLVAPNVQQPPGEGVVEASDLIPKGREASIDPSVAMQ